MPKPGNKAKTNREAIYPEVAVKLCIEGAEGELTVEKAKALIGWEDENTYREAVIAANPKLKPDKVGFGNDFVLRNAEQIKVRLGCNANNRPFDEGHCRELMQDLLNRRWRFNGEAIIIDEFGNVISGQHRLVMLILAEEERTGKQALHWEALWKGPVTMPCVVVVGVKASADVLATLDNVKARTLADTIYTSDLFNRDKYDEKARKELCRMLNNAVDLLWKRLDAGSLNKWEQRQTNAAALDFQERHAKLVECVKHLHGENSDREISKLKMSAGHCAAMMYLMAQGESDPDAYRNGDPPSQKLLDMGLFDQAEEFWVMVSKGGAVMQQLRLALARAHSPDDSASDDVKKLAATEGSTPIKRALLAKAWQLFRDGQEITEDALTLELIEDKDTPGLMHLADEDRSNFGGADTGDRVPKASAAEDGDPPTEEELNAAKEAEKARRREEIKAKLEADKAKQKDKAAAKAPRTNPAKLSDADKKAMAKEQAEKLKAANAAKKK